MVLSISFNSSTFSAGGFPRTRRETRANATILYRLIEQCSQAGNVDSSSECIIQKISYGSSVSYGKIVHASNYLLNNIPLHTQQWFTLLLFICRFKEFNIIENKLIW